MVADYQGGGHPRRVIPPVPANGSASTDPEATEDTILATKRKSTPTIGAEIWNAVSACRDA
jgi:hypothetical protein